MQVEAFSEIKSIASEKWKEYRQAVKVNKNIPAYKELARAYNHLKNGKKIIDIFKVIQKAGVTENFHPKLAIVKADSKKVRCFYNRDGKVTFVAHKENIGWSKEWRPIASDVMLDKCLPARPNNSEWTIQLEAPVPLIPPKAIPDKLTDDYYILWEVDEWRMIPPTDPYLLKRITKTLFVVVAAWNLTDLEKSVMAGRMS